MLFDSLVSLLTVHKMRPYKSFKIVFLNFFGTRDSFKNRQELWNFCPLSESHVQVHNFFPQFQEVCKVIKTPIYGAKYELSFILFTFVHSFPWLLMFVGLSERMLPFFKIKLKYCVYVFKNSSISSHRNYTLLPRWGEIPNIR